MSEELNNNEGLEPSSSEQEADIMSMSDEDILNMPFPTPMPEEESEYDEGEAEEVAQDDDEDLEEASETEESEEELEDDLPEQEEQEEDDDSEDTEEELPLTEDSDYKAKYEELMAPFRANGKEITVNTPEDLRRLAQMGVGYNAKMAELKPIRKIAKMLENEGLLDAEKINFLIDLSKNDTNAINKLIKDSGINPLDIDTEGTEGYKPNTYTVNDNQLALDEALDELERTPSGQRVIDVVSNKWDKQSKQVLVSNPAFMQQLEKHISDGIFDKVSQAVEQERLFGRIPAGVSDLDAYNAIGQQLAARGEFNPTAPATQQPTSTKTSQDTKRNSRKRAAASTKSKKPANKPVQTALLSMSDEEFEKTLMSKYM